MVSRCGRNRREDIALTWGDPGFQLKRARKSAEVIVPTEPSGAGEYPNSKVSQKLGRTERYIAF